MGKKFKNKYHNKPSNESISAFKQIENFIQEEKNKERDKFSFQQKKVKMPYKMYMGIKNSVLKKHKKEYGAFAYSLHCVFSRWPVKTAAIPF